jgi:tetratricopeptide (TPR) repeat protein
MFALSYVPNRIRILSAGVAASLALAGCDRDESPAIPVAPETAAPATVLPAGGLPPRSTEGLVATFEEAESVYRAGQFAEATGLFESYVGSKPENPRGHYMLGLSAWKSGDLERAASAFNRAIGLDSTHVKSYLNLGRVLLALDRDQEALELAVTVLDIDSTSAEGLRLLARAQHGLGEVDAAIDTYRHALVANDQEVWTMNNLGVLYLEEGDPEAALAPLARAVQLRGTAPVFQNNLGMALERAGFPVAAKRAYEAAVRADSTYIKAVKNRERLSAVAVDSTTVEKVDLNELAELFRQQVKMWRDTDARPARDSATPPAVKPDSVSIS